MEGCSVARGDWIVENGKELGGHHLQSPRKESGIKGFYVWLGG